jgi:2-dehydropantoate 2-reductase
LLKENGYDTTLVCKYTDLAERCRTSGLHVFGHCGDRRIQVPALAGVDEVEGSMDIVLIATKAIHMEEAARSVLPFLKTTSRVVSMQNGIVEEKLARIVGKDRAVGCVVGFGATMHEHGVLEMTFGGEIWVGYLDRDPDPALEFISKMLSNVVPTRSTSRIMSMLYSKLIINSCTSTMGAITGLDLGPLLKIKKARQLFLAIGKEAMDVADAMRLEVPPYGGRIHYRKILKQHPLRQHAFLRLFGWKYHRLRSTNLRSLEMGKPTEIEYLNGYIVQQGKAHGVDTPVNRRLSQMVQEIEKKRRPITPVNLEEITPDERT